MNLYYHGALKKLAPLAVFFLLSAPILSFVEVSGADEDDILKVGKGWDYATIGSALEDAEDGDTIEVYPGIYNEILVLNDQVYLRGAGTERPLIVGTGEGPVVTISADGCEIEGLEIDASAGGQGINISSDGNLVRDCWISSCSAGIALWNSRDNTIIENEVRGTPSPDEGICSGGYPTPVGHWKLDGPTWTGRDGEVKDSSGYGSDGKTQGDVHLAPGKFGSCAAFDGDRDYIQVDYENVLNINGPELTMEAWVRFDAFTPKSMIVDKEESYEFRIANGNVVWAIMTQQKEWYWVNTEVKIPLGEWVHVAVTYDSEVVRTFVNFELKDTYDYPYGNVRTSPLPFVIGAGYKWQPGWDWDYFCLGMIDEVKIYDRAVDYEEPYEGGDPAAAGILLQYSDMNYLGGNIISGFSGEGIKLFSSSDNGIRGNDIRDNTMSAVYFDQGSSSNMATYNEIHNNNRGSKQGQDEGSNNRWDTGSLGNYWSEWTLPDSNGDLIVDIPYDILGSAGSKDQYPLIHGSKGSYPPEILTDDVTNAVAGSLYLVSYSARDKDTTSDQLVWSMSTDASWLSFSSSKVLSGTPSLNDTGSFWVNITVNDGSLQDSTNFTLKVTSPSEGGGEYEGSEIHMDEDSQTTFIELEELFGEINGDVQYSVGSSENILLVIVDGRSLVIHPTSDWSGSEQVSITAVSGGSSVTELIDVTVRPVNDPPYQAYFFSQIKEDRGISTVVMVGEVKDDDLEYGDTLTYSWFIEELGIVGNGREVSLSLEPGTYDITLRVVDSAGEFTEYTGEVVVPSGQSTDGPEEPSVLNLSLPLLVLGSAVVMIFVVAGSLLFIFRRRREGPVSEDQLIDRDQESFSQGSRFGPRISGGHIGPDTLLPRTTTGDSHPTGRTIIEENAVDGRAMEALYRFREPGEGEIQELSGSLDGLVVSGRISRSTARSIKAELKRINK
ncbi:MAG: LamG-like jellyroll fold domain-containing protein [Thermoplasmatota archaeon]